MRDNPATINLDAAVKHMFLLSQCGTNLTAAPCDLEGGIMITGAHAIIYSRDAQADRNFLRDVLGFPHVDGGHGWLIFSLPPAEVAVHPSGDNDRHELYLMCDDVEAMARTLQAQGVACSALHEEPWGKLVNVTLPGGGTLGVYQPRHPRPPH